VVSFVVPVAGLVLSSVLVDTASILAVRLIVTSVIPYVDQTHSEVHDEVSRE
jgi:hypothetical protein